MGREIPSTSGIVQLADAHRVKLSWNSALVQMQVIFVTEHSPPSKALARHPACNKMALDISLEEQCAGTVHRSSPNKPGRWVFWRECPVP